MNYYPKDPEFKKKYGPRGVLHTRSDGKGGQKIEEALQTLGAGQGVVVLPWQGQAGPRTADRAGAAAKKGLRT